MMLLYKQKTAYADRLSPMSSEIGVVDRYWQEHNPPTIMSNQKPPAIAWSAARAATV